MPMRELGDIPSVDYYLTDPDTGLPVDATITVTLTDPAGASVPQTYAHPAVGHYRARPVFTTIGTWTVTFTAAGAVTDTESVVFDVVPAAAGALTAPGWAPSLEDVAVHIPTRTREVGDLGLTETYALTFTADTTPTGEAADRVIRHACAWVMARTGSPVVAAAYGPAAVAAALWAAYWIEIGYPERDADVSVYERLRVDAEAATKAAADLNVAAGGGHAVEVAPVGQGMVTYSFPAPVSHGDRLIY